MSKLNARQWALYEFLKSKYDDGKFISTEAIVNALPQHYSITDGCGSKCRLLVSDVRVINNNDTIQKLIISSRNEHSNGYKIGTQEECNEYLNKRFDTLMKSLKFQFKLRKKTRQDGQMKMTFGTSERDVIEAFIKQ